MESDRLRERIAAHFSDRSERADIWQAFDLFLETDAFLNLGYSEWYQPHVVASSQGRLVTEVGSTLARHLAGTEGVRLLDLGCGRGGPAVRFTEEFGFRVTGIDLVWHNVVRATETARESGSDSTFVVGDATQLPFAPDSFPACAAVDALVYLPERAVVFEALAEVLTADGVFVFSDLVRHRDADETGRRAVASFAEVWDMPALGTVPEYQRGLSDAGFERCVHEHITPYSVGQFRKWTTLFLTLYTGPTQSLVDRFLRHLDLDPSTVVDQIRRAHEALPHLQHVIFVAEK